MKLYRVPLLIVLAAPALGDPVVGTVKPIILLNMEQRSGFDLVVTFRIIWTRCPQVNRLGDIEQAGFGNVAFGIRHERVPGVGAVLD